MDGSHYHGVVAGGMYVILYYKYGVNACAEICISARYTATFN